MALGGCWRHGMASADINIPWVCDAERVVRQTGDCGDNVKALSERSRPGRSAKSRRAKDELTETPGNFVGPLCVAAPGRWLTMRREFNPPLREPETEPACETVAKEHGAAVVGSDAWQRYAFNS